MTRLKVIFVAISLTVSCHYFTCPKVAADLLGAIDLERTVCLFLPAPLVALVFLPDGPDKLQSIVFLARCYSGRLKGCIPTLWPDFPGADWVHSVQAELAQARPNTRSEPLTASRLTALADTLRDYAQRLCVAYPVDEEDQADMVRRLRRDIMWVTDLARQLQGDQRDGGAGVDCDLGSSGVKHSAARILAAFSAMKHMRHRAQSFQHVLQHAVEAVWPGMIGDMHLQPSFSPSFIFRSQLIVDMALVRSVINQGTEGKLKRGRVLWVKRRRVFS